MRKYLRSRESGCRDYVSGDAGMISPVSHVLDALSYSLKGATDE